MKADNPYGNSKVICGICKRPPDGTYTIDENVLPCGHHCDNLIEVMADYEIIDLSKALAEIEYRSLTEAELWAQVVAGEISPALYLIRAGQIAQVGRSGKRKEKNDENGN